MVKFNEFCSVHSECCVLLDSLESTTNYASKLLGFIGVTDEDEDDNVTKLQHLSVEHLENLQRIAKQLSSYADRFANKLHSLKEVVDRV